MPGHQSCDIIYRPNSRLEGVLTPPLNQGTSPSSSKSFSPRNLDANTLILNTATGGSAWRGTLRRSHVHTQLLGVAKFLGLEEVLGPSFLRPVTIRLNYFICFKTPFSITIPLQGVSLNPTFLCTSNNSITSF